jgi:hypothetical protein
MTAGGEVMIVRVHPAVPGSVAWTDSGRGDRASPCPRKCPPRMHAGTVAEACCGDEQWKPLPVRTNGAVDPFPSLEGSFQLPEGFGASRSITSKAMPVRSSMLAFGHRCHHSSICAALVVASCRPWLPSRAGNQRKPGPSPKARTRANFLLNSQVRHREARAVIHAAILFGQKVRLPTMSGDDSRDWYCLTLLRR